MNIPTGVYLPSLVPSDHDYGSPFGYNIASSAPTGCIGIFTQTRITSRINKYVFWSALWVILFNHRSKTSILIHLPIDKGYSKKTNTPEDITLFKFRIYGQE
jgi:hypothetical protein